MNKPIFVIGIGSQDTSTVARMIKKPINGGEIRGNTAYSKSDTHTTAYGEVKGARITIESGDWLEIQAEIEGTYTTEQDGKTNVYLSSRAGNLFSHIDKIKEIYVDSIVIVVHSQVGISRVIDKINEKGNVPALERITELRTAIEAYIQGMQPTQVDFNTDIDYILPNGEYVRNCVDETETKVNIEYYVV